jgi:putative transposase
MPAKHTQRSFIEGGLYHIYNSAKKDLLFKEEEDYKTFLFYLYIYVRPIKSVLQQYDELPFRLQIKNLNKEVDILTYCLMPDHFHIIVKQTSLQGVQKLLKQVTNAYTEYFNKKYRLTGPVVKGRYKAIVIEKEKHLLELSRYIHLHPVISQISQRAQDYEWSSMKEFENTSSDAICNKRLILSYFSSNKDFVRFTNDIPSHMNSKDKIEDVKID